MAGDLITDLERMVEVLQKNKITTVEELNKALGVQRPTGGTADDCVQLASEPATSGGGVAGAPSNRIHLVKPSREQAFADSCFDFAVGLAREAFQK